jgi:hypothetical protein
MKFLTIFLTTLVVTGHAMAAFNKNTPTRNLKGRQVEAKPEHTSHNIKTRKMQGSAPTGNNEVVIEVTYDDFPEETGWSLMDSAGTVIASQPTGTFLTVGGFVSRTVFVAGGEYIFEMTDSFGDGICCDLGIGEFTITVNGEPVAIGGNGDFGDVIQETFDVVDAPTSAPTIVPTITLEILEVVEAPTSAPTIPDSRSAAIGGGVASGVVLIAAVAVLF